MGATPNPNTLWSMSKKLTLYESTLPMGLAMYFIQSRYKQVFDSPDDAWGVQFGDGLFLVAQSIFGNCTATYGSTLFTNVVAQQGIGSVTVAAAGNGYNVGDTVLPLAGAASAGLGAVLTVATVTAGPGSGVATLTVTNPGYNWTEISNVATAAITGAGTGLIINISTLGNGALPGNRTTIVGRQAIFQGIAPFYDIIDNSTANSFQTVNPWGLPTQVVSFEISNVYFTPDSLHSDFERLITWVDPPFGVQYPFTFTFEEINNIDAQRSGTGTPFLLADSGWNSAYLAALPAGVTDSFGQTNQSQPVPRKELYPRQQQVYQYPYRYKRRVKDLVNPNDMPQGLLAGRGDILVEGALADLSLWPGTANYQRNPNPVAFNVHQKRFDILMQELYNKDQSQMQRSFQSLLSNTRLPFPAAFWGSSFAQIHPGLGLDGFSLGYDTSWGSVDY